LKIFKTMADIKKDEKQKEEPKKDANLAKIEELEKKNKEYLESWKRERADSLNYKKDEMERIQALIKYAQEGQILKMLPILDNFNLAEKNIPEDLKKDEHVKGILQISKQIKEFLKGQGIEEIESLGRTFDPNRMEAMEEISKPEYKLSGVVVEEISKGYMIGDRVLRPAKVKISK